MAREPAGRAGTPARVTSRDSESDGVDIAVTQEAEPGVAAAPGPGPAGREEREPGSRAGAVPPHLVPAEGFTGEEKVKDRVTLKDWDPVSWGSDHGISQEKDNIVNIQSGLLNRCTVFTRV